MTAYLSPEVSAFVLESISPRTPSMEQPPAFYQDSISWSEALQFADLMQSGPAFLETVQAAAWWNEIPESTRHSIQAAAQTYRMALGLLDHELDFALETLTAAKIPVMVIKGMDVGRRFYPKRELRTMNDVDLLVPTDAFQYALSTLGRVGYQAVGQYPSGAFRIDISRFGKAPVIDLHGKLLVNDSKDDLQGYWQRSLTGAFDDLPSEARALSADDCLLYMIQHNAVQHRLESAAWLCDIYFIMEMLPNLDWDSIVQKLARRKALSATWFSFQLLYAQWGCVSSESALQAVARKLPKWKRRLLVKMAARDRWFAAQTRSTRVSLTYRRTLLRDSLFEAVKYGFRRFTPEHQPAVD